jgi:hypothetical protein
MHYRLRTLLPFQTSLRWLFGLTTLMAVVFAVIALPSNLAEKINALTAFALHLQAWFRRNYLHPIQATLPHAFRCRIARLDFVTTIVAGPPLFVFLFFKFGHSRNHIMFTDVLSWGSIAALFGLATWKLVRAYSPHSQWANTIELPELETD